MASNPLSVSCTKDTWTKIATNVVTGTVYKQSNAPANYLQTFKLTGEAAPTDEDEAVVLFEPGRISVPISSDSAIDVYVMAKGADGVIVVAV
jgi:hypothetical protein